ncbi:MAG: ATP-binding protein [Lachnospiraceae bacterium]|nr:ATP-binding protein [Lachnospiraceae bacterium]
MKVKHGLGYQNYEDMMANHIFYIDKTNFIREWWEYADKVTLITRPRRFGKTLNLSTVECFFSNKYKGRSDLFEGRLVWKDEDLRKLQGTYPVIFMSFAGVKSGYGESEAGEKLLDNVETMKTAVKQIISDIYAKFRDIMKSESFDENDRAYFASVNDNMTDRTAHVAIRRLCGYLEKVYGKKVIILLDEYDTPMQESWVYGYWNHAVAFFRRFFVTTFKDNDSIERGLITGITRISKESIFSELNHLEVVTTVSDKYSTSFGFTEEEVFQVLDELNLSKHKEDVKRWYDGFTFGKSTDIYNPWSIIAFISKDGEYAPYWANTSSNSLVSTLIQTGDIDAKKTVEDLMKGKSFTAPIEEQIVFDQLEGNTNAVWSLLLASGYLKMTGREPLRAEGKGRPRCTLALTNMEVALMFEDMVRSWFEMDVESSAYNDFIKAMLLDDVDYMNEFMNEIALKSFSNFDVAKNASCNDHPERFYHGFVLGLMVGLRDQFEITSNRESGFGRYDIVLKPYDMEKNNAYIIEFKVFKSSKEKTLEDTVVNALMQIEEKQYEASLLANGFTPKQIIKYGFAFHGKTCLIGK